MGIFDWITEELEPEESTTVAMLYDHMASQSGYCLPIIYEPFDPCNPSHWRDRGAALDFVIATRSQGKRVLDFGPGDGWPSLIIAPFVGDVVGVDGSARRVAVCRENAARLDIENATFVHVPPGSTLPFPDNSFDAVVAASSLEQTPDPRTTLAELYRILKPGGRLRMVYEALNRYRGGQEREIWLSAVDEETTTLMLYERRPDEENTLQAAITASMSKDELTDSLGSDGQIQPASITPEKLSAIRGAIISSGVCSTTHPSGPTWLRWMSDIGFSEARATHSAIYTAGLLFETLPPRERPGNLADIDAYLRPFAEVVVELLAPADRDPMLTAVK